MRKISLVLLTLVSASTFAAPVYKCEKNGVPTYTNTPCSNGTGDKVTLPELSITSSFKSSTSSTSSPGSSSTPSVTQVKTTDGQRQRDSKRSEILNDELKREEDALGKAVKTLAEQKEVRNGDEKNYQKVLERIKPYEDEVALRKKNVDAIKKEMETTR